MGKKKEFKTSTADFRGLKEKGPQVRLGLVVDSGRGGGENQGERRWLRAQAVRAGGERCKKGKPGSSYSGREEKGSVAEGDRRQHGSGRGRQPGDLQGDRPGGGQGSSGTREKVGEARSRN